MALLSQCFCFVRVGPSQSGEAARRTPTANPEEARSFFFFPQSLLADLVVILHSFRPMD